MIRPAPPGGLNHSDCDGIKYFMCLHAVFFVPFLFIFVFNKRFLQAFLVDRVQSSFK